MRKIHIIFLLGLLNLNGCMMINKGLQSLPGILLAALGILLLYAGIKLFWKHTGNKEVPSLVRFLFGMMAVIFVLVA